MKEIGYIEESRKRVREKYNWDNYNKWTNYNFERISKDIKESTGISVSTLTLMRYFNKVKTNSENYNPNITTKNAIALLLGFNDWEDFKQNSKPKKRLLSLNTSHFVKTASFIAFVIIMFYLVKNVISNYRDKIPEDFYLSADYTTDVFPQTVVFKYKIDNIQSDSVYLSFNDKLQKQNIRLNKPDSIYTHYFAFPGLYRVYLKLNKKKIDSTLIVVESENWNRNLKIGNNEDKYIKINNNIDSKGYLNIPRRIIEKHIDTSVYYYQSNYAIIKNFKVDESKFTLKTRLRNTDISEDRKYCNFFKIYIIGEHDKFVLNVNDNKCYAKSFLKIGSSTYNKFNSELSSLGIDMKDWIDVSVNFLNGDCRVNLNNNEFKKSYIGEIGKIYQLLILFSTSGEIDYVNVYNYQNKLVYSEDFNK